MAIDLMQTTVKSKQPGRPAKRPSLTAYQAKQIAQKMLSGHEITPSAERILDLLGNAGVLTAGQIAQLVGGISPRSLQRYQVKHLVDRLPADLAVLVTKGFSDQIDPSLRVYTLGMVGVEIMKINLGEGKYVTPSYYGGQRSALIHDLIVNEVVVRLRTAAAQRGCGALWFSKQEATVLDENKTAVLQPDALVVITKGRHRRFLAIEVHNEDHGNRVPDKIRRYERVYKGGRWVEKWKAGSDESVAVITVFTVPIVGQTYAEQVGKEAANLNLSYLGKSWESVVNSDDQDIALWGDYARRTKVDVFSDEFLNEGNK